MTRILVDSSSDYTQEDIKAKGIEFVPIIVSFNGQEYEDGITLDRNDFFQIMENTTEFPKTSQPSPEKFLNIFEEVKEAGDEMICILLSSSLSGTYQSAMLAKDMTEYDGIYVIDSLTATFCIKLLADRACELRDQGMPAAQIAAHIEKAKSRVRVLAALDTLDYLQRGGRIPKAVAKIGDMVSLKPIITVDQEGQVQVIGKCLGKNKAISYIVDMLKEQSIDPTFPVYAIYSYGTKNCLMFREKLKEINLHVSDEILQIGSTIGSHIGPEAFGIIYAVAE